MSRTDKVDAEKAGDNSPEAETGKIVETAGEALAKAGFEPSKAGRRIVGQGKPREPLRKRTCRTEKTEEEKVFIYDIALLLNDFTRERHPGLLVHDNIFDVDNDTLEKSLEYLLTRAPFDDGQQYILTLNVDRLERYSDEAWYEELGQNVVASFTKSNRFLKVKYQEIGS